MNKFLSIAVAGLVGVGAIQAQSAKASNHEVVFGFAASYSGWMQAYSDPPTKAAMIAIEEINAAGGLLGKKITTVKFDAKTDRVQGAKAGTAALSAGAQVLAVDCDYDFGAPAALAAQKAGKISIFLCAESVLAGIQGVGKFSFSASVLAAVQGATTAEWGWKKKGWRTAYLLLDETIEYDKGICYGFDWMWREKLGGKILGHDVFQNADPSIASQITRIKNLPQEPDVISLCSFVPGGASAIRQIRAAGIKSAIASGSAMSGTYWLSSVPNLSNHYVPEQASIYGDDPNPAVNAFNAKYKAKYGAGVGSQYTYPGYVMIEMWAKAVKRAGSFDSAKVVAELEKFKNEPVLAGTRTFTKTLHHQNYAPYLIVETTNGKPKVVESFLISEPVPMDVLFGKRYKYIAR